MGDEIDEGVSPVRTHAKRTGNNQRKEVQKRRNGVLREYKPRSAHCSTADDDDTSRTAAKRGLSRASLSYGSRRKDSHIRRTEDANSPPKARAFCRRPEDLVFPQTLAPDFFSDDLMPWEVRITSSNHLVGVS